MKKVFSILLLLLTFSSLVHAQNSTNPPTPPANGNAGSVYPIGNSGAMANQTNNVDLSTGGVFLSIPIYSLGSRNLSTTVSLSYNSPYSPFWIDEYPSSWVGRDWNLNAGGVITREINSSSNSYVGVIDSAQIMSISPNMLGHCWETMRIDNRLYDHVNYGHGIHPDIYYYNFDGYSGRFILEKDSSGIIRAYTIPHSDLKIVPPSNSNDIWKIYTPEGTIYTFGGEFTEKTDYTSNNYDINVTENLTSPWTTLDFGWRSHDNPAQFAQGRVQVSTSWYLNKINAPYQQDSITFEYGYPTYSDFNQTTEQNFINYETGKEDIRRYFAKEGWVTNQRRIKAIHSSSGTLSFIESEVENEKIIRTIRVINKENQLIHNYELNYTRKQDDYFLTSLQEKVTNCIQKPPYLFKYLMVNGTDPRTDPDYSSIFTYDYMPGALQKVIYPEGGYVKFIYESNKADLTEWQYKDVEEKFVVIAPTKQLIRWIEVDHDQTISLKASAPRSLQSNYTIIIQKAHGTEVFRSTVEHAENLSIPLTAGKYKIMLLHNVYATLGLEGCIYAQLDLKWKQKWIHEGTINSEGKGVRIRKIEVHDGIDMSKNIIKTYKYELEDGFSSGRLIAPPLKSPVDVQDYNWYNPYFEPYTHTVYSMEYSEQLSGGFFDTTYLVKSYKVYTLPEIQLKGATQIQYTKVTEILGEQAENGYIEHYFSFEPNEIASSYPLFTKKDNDWKRGLPTQTKIFDKDGNLIQKSASEYTFSTYTDTLQYREWDILSVANKREIFDTTQYRYLLNYNNSWLRHPIPARTLAYHFGKIVSGSIFLKKTTTTNYDQDNSGNSITSSTEYEYSDKYLFPNRVIQNENNGDKTISESKYVLDYDTNLGSSNQIELAALRDMKEKHIISPTIEQTVWKQLGGQSEKQLLGASLSTYQIYQTNILENLHMTQSANYKRYFALVPLTTYTFEPINTVQPILSNDFVFSSITPTGLEWDTRYKKRVIYEGSDRFGNITSAREINGTPSATIFGYNGLFPVASISGASHRQVAYEGFESYGEENPYSDLKEDQVFRGKYSSGRFIANYIEGLPLQRRYLIYPNPFQPIPKGTYTLSFWAKGTVSIELQSSYNDNYNLSFTGSIQEWTYHERDISLNYNAAYHTQNPHHLLYKVGGDDNVRIDEIRFQPKNSFMTTTTYKPLIGVTHTTDAEQRTGSYYYDPLRRVESVRDHNNNLIKSYEYKYMSDDDNPNPLFSISTTPTPESLINTSVSIEVNRTDFNRCLNTTSPYPHKWNFGDGTTTQIDDTTVTNQSHSYSQAGTYVITLSVEVVTGYWVDAHTSIRIIDPTSPPDFTNELTATLNGIVDASNSLCYDFVATPNGGVPPFTYQWFSGDGTSNPSQTTSQINYCYTTFGNFTPQVFVTDATGATANATFDITVTNPIEQLTAEIISANEFCRGTCAFFEANVSGGSLAYTYLWEIINPLTNRNISLGTTSSLSFKIPNPTPSNRYTVYLTVTDSEGREVTTTKTVIVLSENSCNRRINDPILIDPIGGGIINPTPVIASEPFVITNRRGQTVDPTAISLGDNIVFTSPYIESRYTYNWEVSLNGNVITTLTNSNPSLPINFLLEGNYTIRCSVTQLLNVGGIFGGGNPRPVPVGSSRIQISICNALTLPRF